MRWRAMVINGTFLEILDSHRQRMEQEGFKIVPIEEPGRKLSVDRVHALADTVDVIFGPGPGLNAELFQKMSRLKVISLAASGYESVDVGRNPRGSCRHQCPGASGKRGGCGYGLWPHVVYRQGHPTTPPAAGQRP